MIYICIYCILLGSTEIQAISSAKLQPGKKLSIQIGKASTEHQSPANTVEVKDNLKDP